MNATGRLRSTWDMIKFQAEDFAKFIEGAGNMRRIAEQSAGNLSEQFFDVTEQMIFKLSHACATTGLRMTALSANSQLSILKGLRPLALAGNTTVVPEIARGLESIQERLTDELSLQYLLALTPKEADWLDPNEPRFGKAVEDKFPSSAAYEIEEAGKCIALNRDTAAVFHLMRVMEIGIKAVATCLGVPDPSKPAERNWGFILKGIKDANLARNSSGASGWKIPADKEFFESTYASLDAVKTAWRNTTMHVENKYTSDEAEHIFISVRGFMKKLASRMDEQGLPLA